MERSNPRAQKLQRTFYDIVTGKVELTPYNASLFLEAVTSFPDPAICVDKLMANKCGLSALQQAMRCRLNTAFFNKEAADVLAYFQAPALKNINSGQYLNDIVYKIAYPPMFWDPFRQAFLEGVLDDKAQIAAGWFLLTLCCLPNPSSAPYRNHQDTAQVLAKLLSSPSAPIRNLGQKLKHVLGTCMSASAAVAAGGPGPGGRHDNDFEDFRKISILPTADEIASSESPFLRQSDALEDPQTEDGRVALHYDNQFRLLREDMLYEMREELQKFFGKKKGHHRGVKITDLFVEGIDCGEENKRTKWSLSLKCAADILVLDKQGTIASRKEFLDDHRNFLKHQSVSCLLSGTEIIAFPTIIRDRDRLAKMPPEIVLQFDRPESVGKALLKLKTDPNVMLIQIDTAIFSFEPVLRRLQAANTLPLSSELLLWKQSVPVSKTTCQAMTIVDALHRDPNCDLQNLLGTPKSIKLDASQATALVTGLTQEVSLLQGPPGTGKSFIGALLAKALYRLTPQTILVVCYTNHALDDILTHLLNIGIPEEDMLRLGGKSTTVTEPLTKQNQKRIGSRSRDQWMIIDSLKDTSERLCNHLDKAFKKYNSPRIHYRDILVHLEFESPAHFAAFSVPDPEDGMTMVDRTGREIKPHYLIDRWRKNQDAGVFSGNTTDPEIQQVWRTPAQQRRAMWRNWEEAILQESIVEFSTIASEYDENQERLSRALSTDLVQLLKSKRVVGCTTTAAAKYCDDISTFNPDVLLVEEAGEILESHVLTSLGPETSQIILIGDHKQLRPKVNNYLLTVEKGEGYDLNRSLFERLILKGYPHETLAKQHRMRPEISSLIRTLTYPELLDADSTKNHPSVLGLQDNIVFIHHENPEDENTSISDRRDGSSTSSKHNKFEIDMILKIVKYLGQQGYGTEDLVILTPYLGQLQKLRLALRKDNDPILNDLDSYELVKAGLVNPAEAKLTKKPIRITGADNFQGEEADIVVVSLTRSNDRHEIGFLSAPERLNVLLSRSRNGLVMIGNATTFKNARKGKELWTKLFDQLTHGKHIYDGVPVKCEQHPDKTAVLRQPEDFELLCPDGGCSAPCGVLLSCGMHPCPSKCHQLSDHSKMTCEEPIVSLCTNGHKKSSTCSKGLSPSCPKCDRDAELAKKRLKEESLANERREAEQRAHLRKMDELNARIDEAKRSQEEARLAKERASALRQKEDDLAALLAAHEPRHLAASSTIVEPVGTSSHNSQVASPQPSSHSSSLPTSPIPDNVQSLLDGSDQPFANADGALDGSVAPLPTVTPAQTLTIPPKPFPQLPLSAAKEEWEHQKRMHGISNAAIDSIMNMIGLEDVKRQILEILAKIEASTRQGASLKKERFNVVFLGNAGTGKTTVARSYAQFLASVKVTPADTFEETTGSRLAHEGVDGTKRLLYGVIKSGGGTIFIDEAYQLASGHNSQGAAVLDYLLAEMENNVGTVVFILAGYIKEMEKFFEHNQGLKSRVPLKLHFADYKDEELMAIFQSILTKTFLGRMKVDDGFQGRYARIMIRRLGRRRGSPGFGNARDLETAFDRVRGNQAARLAKIRKQGGRPDDFFLSAEDLIGPDPSKAIQESDAWRKLHSLIGLKAVKDSVTSLFNMIEENYRRELAEKEPLAVSLNRVFFGSPGTGKTTVAKLYGQILANLGLLTSGEVVLKSPSDFIGNVLGASESQTKAILSNCVGKVLIIDEAYMLYGGGGKDGSGLSNSNQFKTAVIDTIVAEVQNVPGEDRCVLLLGYKDQMLEMFQNVNEGLKRRFDAENPFSFEDFDDAELFKILDLKLGKQQVGATDYAKTIAIEVLSRARNRPNFGNAGEVENLITQAKIRCVARRTALPIAERQEDIVFEPEDFDPDYNRGANASLNLSQLFEDVIGYADIVERMANYQEVARTCKERKLNAREHIPTNFVFTGPPGTGKTTVARKMGQVFYDMGILASAEVIECSASDLVGQYIGQTGPKTKKLFEKALGKVLFIDEAYRLSGGHFAQEAIDELVGLLTHPTYKSRLIVILAGYEKDMNYLMEVNSGLSSRFPDQIFFHDMDADHCLQVVAKELEKKSVKVDGLDDPLSMFYRDMKEMIRDLSELMDWGNARDMMTLSREIISLALRKSGNSGAALELSQSDALDALRKILADRQRRTKKPTKARHGTAGLPVQSQAPDPPTPPPIDIATGTDTNNPPPPSSASQPESRASTPNSQHSRGRGRGRGAARGDARGRIDTTRGRSRGGASALPPSSVAQTSEQDPTERDPGVSDAIWRQLVEAKRAADSAERTAKTAINGIERSMKAARSREQKEEKAFADLEKAEADERDLPRRSELQRQREEARLKAHAARVEREKAAEELRKRREAEQRRKEQEQKAQRKLREMGVCPCRLNS
ncbi:hypothetical protein NLJ89_g6011 [Agrocybe chaxingu]|uniref:AAA+ ATPase domain-containing protein n=1 Tax=Agrocybe chaxingu TaxID=84603 RepID=A0A9W8MT39_9AGAR|nr:hypothetical protein NLJ89_g6011 [Agrocybe chaxingu]